MIKKQYKNLPRIHPPVRHTQKYFILSHNVTIIELNRMGGFKCTKKDKFFILCRIQLTCPISHIYVYV